MSLSDHVAQSVDDGEEPRDETGDQHDQSGDQGGDQSGQPAVPEGPLGVSVVHDVRAPGAVALVCAVLTVAWFARALGSGQPLDWAMCLVPAAVGALMLAVLRDARAPLFVADDQGVRIRDGVTWTGLRWSDVEQVEVRRRHRLRDGELVVHLAHPVEPVTPEESDDTPPEAVASREVRVPLGLGTRVQTEGMTGSLVDDLGMLAAGTVPVVVLAAEPEPQPEPEPAGAAPEQADDPRAPDSHESHDEALEEPPADPRPDDPQVVSERMQVVVLSSTDPAYDATADGHEGLAGPDPVLPEQPGPDDPRHDLVVATEADLLDDPLSDPVGDPAGDPVGDPGVDGLGPVRGLEPGRATRDAARSEVVREGGRRLPDLPAIPAQRATDELVVTARIDDLDLSPAPTPAPDPVIGPVIAAARQRARLSVDTLSERTRIRPHVLECLEVDDFEACGGDFYARGHLRTLARTFGLDAEALLATYDERYASPAIDARQVFEAELASGIGGGVRAATRGPRWSLLAASVLLLVGIWGAARVFSDTPQELVSPAPDVVDTVGLTGEAPEAPQVALSSIRLTVEGGNPQVAVRDGEGRILFAGQLEDGRTMQLVGNGPFDVTASNGQAVRVTYLGEDRGTVGDDDQGAARQFE